MRDNKFCHDCGTRVRASAKFCGRCGTRLKHPSTGRSTEDNQKLRQLAPVSKTLDVKESTELIGEFERTSSHLSHVKQQLRNLRMEIQTVNQEYYRSRQIRIREQSEVDELKTLSWKSLSSRLRGSLKEKLKAEEIDVIRAAAKEQLVLEQLQELQKTAQELRNERERLKEKLMVLRKTKALPRIDKETTILVGDLSKLEEDLEDLLAGREFLEKARVDLDRTISEFEADLTIDVIDETLERSQISSAQHHVSNAEANIRQARFRLSSVEHSGDQIEVPTLILDGFFDSLFTDFLSHQKIKETRRRCEQSRDRVISVITQVTQAINGLQNRISELDKDPGIFERAAESAGVELDLPDVVEGSRLPTQLDSSKIVVPEINGDDLIGERKRERPSSEPEIKVTEIFDESTRGALSEEEGLDVVPESDAHLESIDDLKRLPETFLEDLDKARYRFKSIEISKNEVEAVGTFYTDKPQQVRWTRDASGFIIRCEGRISVRWNATLNFIIKPIEKFSWGSPYHGLELSCDHSQVKGKIEQTSRVAEKLRSNPLLEGVHAEVLERGVKIRFRFRDVPRVRASVDLARDLILALELVLKNS